MATILGPMAPHFKKLCFFFVPPGAYPKKLDRSAIGQGHSSDPSQAIWVVSKGIDWHRLNGKSCFYLLGFTMMFPLIRWPGRGENRYNFYI